jgi:hypothetical protein
LSKHIIALTLVELYACKHALQKQVAINIEKQGKIVDGEFGSWDGDLIKEFETLEKDINHEKALITRFESEILEYKAAKRIN